jgi:hypothetical protein
MGLARRYIIEVVEIVPTGASSVERTVEYDLTEAFSGTNGSGDVVTYDGITTNDIITLSNDDYENRVDDFLYLLQIDEEGGYDKLNNSSTFDSTSCN